MTGPIDAAVTWVDGADPAHLQKRQRYAGEAVLPGTLANAADPMRFHEVGELWYAIHLARQHAPWLRTIHLVTDAQRPAWLTDAVARELGVHLVDHTVLFRGYEDCLPTFNSQSIEAMLWRIPGLAERFIYLNDDVFIVRPVTPDAYFQEDRPVFRGRWTWRNRALAYIERQGRRVAGRGEGLAGLVGLRPERELLGGLRYFRSAHAPHCVNRRDFARYFEDERFLRQVVQHRFRNRNQIWPIGYYVNRALRQGQAVSRESDWAYLSLGASANDAAGLLKRVRDAEHILHLCAQSLDQLPEGARHACFEYLDSLIAADPTKLGGERVRAL